MKKGRKFLERRQLWLEEVRNRDAARLVHIRHAFAKNPIQAEKDYAAQELDPPIKIYPGNTSDEAWGDTDADKVFQLQKGRCAICDHNLRPVKSAPQHGLRKAARDHDHNTGKPRGLLCLSCNTLLGLAGDNCDVLRSAVAYIQYHKSSGLTIDLVHNPGRGLRNSDNSWVEPLHPGP